jgi:type 1 glutamine amidotransferase
MSKRPSHSAAAPLVSLCALLALVVVNVSGSAQAPAPATPAVQAGVTPVKALIVSGGCCHDYPTQAKLLMDMLNPLMPIHWTAVVGMSSIPNARLPFFENPDWAKGYDIVIHNECWVGDPSTQHLQQIAAQHRTGIPAVFLHCALHSYRSSQSDEWRELIGITSRRHTRAHNFAVKWEDDPITAGLPPFVTPIDELYVVEKVWPGVKSVASVVNTQDNGFQGPNETYPVAWTHEYRGARVFGTSIGHGNETWNTNQFKELMVRGFRWALKKEPIVLPPPARAGGAAAAGRGQ